ncbi:MAG: hypothetical protein QUV10_15605 [Paracoccaceae bacterium]|nr:hypothetical protein [Paracoccaceae bacterium]
MENTESIKEVVSKLVNDRFPNARIVSVDIQKDFDFDDDEIIKVRVVFHTENERLDAKATSSFLRYLRPKLSEIGVRNFPVMSFVSDRDARGAAA